jgi:hypothetical protein
MTLPIVMTVSGVQPRSPVDINTELITNVAAIDPGYTVLPGSLIEDISSTDTAAISLCDQAKVDLINSITPFGANEFLLNQLGQVYGVQLGQTTNTSVFVTFTSTSGFVINAGFVVSDGAHQYYVQDGGIVNSFSYVSLFCVASTQGTWAVPVNSVTTIITSVPSAYTVTCTNPVAGTPSTSVESWDNYRERVLIAGKAASTGMATYLKTLINEVPGVQTRLVSVRQVSGNWQILCGGGDPYSVGYAIFRALFDINHLVGSSHTERNVVVSVLDVPDRYNITYVNPTLQNVAINLTWNTTLTNFVSDASVSILVSNALAEYINTLYVGDYINIFEMESVFQIAVAGFIPAQNISRFVFSVYINSVLTAPNSGTGLVEGDPESYFSASPASIIVSRG